MYLGTKSTSSPVFTADCACVSTITKDALLPVASAVFGLAAMFLVMWRMDHTLTLVAVSVVPCLALVFRAYATTMMERSYQEQEVEGKIYEQVEQTFAAIPVVQAFGREADNDRRFAAATRNALAATLNSTRVQMEFKVLIGLATALGTTSILWIENDALAKYRGPSPTAQDDGIKRAQLNVVVLIFRVGRGVALGRIPCPARPFV